MLAGMVRMSNNLEAIERLKARADPPECHTSGDSEMAAMLAEVDLLALIQADTGEQGRKSADRIDFKSCPICGHLNCFSYYPTTNSWSCYSKSNTSGYAGGTAIEFYKATRTDDDTEVSEIQFDAESFSVYGVVYTVDFEYDGYTFSIPGEGTILLSALAEQLKLAEKGFSIENVKEVTFSNSELLKIEQKDGDWLLTSLKPFLTEETLTIVMADGAKFIIKVTDAQDAFTANVHFVSVDDDGTTLIPEIPGVGEAPPISDTLYVRVYLVDEEGALVAWGISPMPKDRHMLKLTHWILQILMDILL